jgi:hypothetical protein
MWSDAVWPRAFWFDAFLSHRRSDWSRQLAAELGACGVRAYHDHDVDVRDARVEFELDHALRNSRFVVVCLTPQYGDSLYGRLEYLPALRHSAEVDVQRVMVVRRDHDSPLPAELTGAPVFDVRDDAGVKALAAFITRQNRVGFPERALDIGGIQPADIFPKDGPARIEQLDRVILAASRVDQRIFALREVGWCAQAVLAGSTNDILDREQALGAAYISIVKNGIVTREWHDYVWRCAFVMMHAAYPDAAALGTEIFLWAARYSAIPNERELISQRVWAETTLSGGSRLCALLLNRLDELSEPDRDAIERAVVTYPPIFADSRKHLAARGSSTARVKVGIPGLDKKALPPAEGIHLIRSRLMRLQQVWIEAPKSVGLFDTEGVLRELSACVRNEAVMPGALIEVYERALESKGNDPPLVMRLQLPELVDLVYLPLARLHPADPGRVRLLMTAFQRALMSRGFRRTGAVILEQLASNQPFDRVDLHFAIVDDWRDFERDRDGKRTE